MRKLLMSRRVCALSSVLALLVLAAAVLPAVVFGLPPGRVYEMVSPPYKGGYGVKRIEAVAPDGNSVAFYTPGAFAGAPSGPAAPDYVSQRSAAGWSTLPIVVPASLLPGSEPPDLSPTLSSAFVTGVPGSDEEGAYQEGTEKRLLLHAIGLPDTSAMWEQVGALKSLNKEPINLTYVGANPDFCHALFFNLVTETVLLPEALNAPSKQLYEFNRGCDGEAASVRLVGVRNRQGPHGEPELLNSTCGVSAGNEDGTATKTLNDITVGGGEVFFDTGVEPGQCANPRGVQLFARLGGSQTLEVSRPLVPACREVPCAGAAARASAYFLGASEDGSRVFFETQAPLTAEGEGDAIYMAKIGCASGEGEACMPTETANMRVTGLVQISHDPNAGEAADVQGVVRIAPDGSRVYFVAGGVLSGEPNAAGAAAVRGAENLYVYDAVAGKVAFIGDLCSKFERSGSAEDAHCPGTGDDVNLWTNGGEAQTAGAGGRFLVFATYAQLVSADTDAARDIYRYDAETGALERVSGGEGGWDANGNDSLYDAAIALPYASGARTVKERYELESRAVSEDGSRIVFTTAEPLSPDATNGLMNAYEWHEQAGSGEGSVSLISTGSADEPVEDVVISPAGSDIFFVTSQGLVPQDTDGAADVYDARLAHTAGEALGVPPMPAAPAQPCAGDACQGPLTNPAPLLVPGSVAQAPGENLPAPVAATSDERAENKPEAKPKRKRKKAKPAKARRRIKTRRAAGRSGR
jgi:hypothetical protein